MKPGLRYNRRAAAKRDPVWPNVYKVLPADAMQPIAEVLTIENPQNLVTVRDLLAGIFLDQVRSIAGDPVREGVSNRRKDLEQIINLISSLRKKFNETLPDIIKDHRDADWHEPVNWGPSDFRYDYQQLLNGADTIEQICSDILKSPAFNLHQRKGRGPTGLPAKLRDRPTTWAREAFAARLAFVFYAATGDRPTVSGSQNTKFQRFAKICDERFRTGYRQLSNPFGPIAGLSDRDLRKACKRYK